MSAVQTFFLRSFSAKRWRFRDILYPRALECVPLKRQKPIADHQQRRAYKTGKRRIPRAAIKAERNARRPAVSSRACIDDLVFCISSAVTKHRKSRSFPSICLPHRWTLASIHVDICPSIDAPVFGPSVSPPDTP
jgi:hypothetical protein